MTQETRRDLRFPLFALALALAAVAIVVPSVPLVHPLALDQHAASMAILVLAVAASQVLGVLFPQSSVYASVSFPLGIALAVYYGPAYAAAAALVMALMTLFAKPTPSWDRVLFNAAQFTLTYALAAWVYEVGVGSLLRVGVTAAANVTWSALVALIAVLLAIAVNVGSVTVAARILYDRPMLSTLSGLSREIASQVTLGMVGYVLAEIVAAIGPGGIALFVVPLLVARQTYQRTVRLREAYADTIASLVAALEAKDVYTKGHSVRVAKYSLAIAHALGLPDAKIDRLEWAALLHDIGKVGVSRRVLAKNDKLSDDEYTEIKRHPDIGARILADVPYLADLVPSIQGHHQRLDGRGYGGDGGSPEIPLEARIMAVADAYDAMTSTRPYRTACTHEFAVDQLNRGRDTQFDASVVDAFLHAWETGELIVEAEADV